MQSHRAGWLAASLALGIVLGGGTVRAQALPDLIFNGSVINPFLTTETFSAEHCAVQEGCVPAGTRRLLRFRTESWNIGAAHIVLGNPVGNPLFHYHACHQHYHFEGFADYRLVGPAGTVAAGFKASFCLLDTFRHDPTAAPQGLYDCTNQGIQAGWADVYTADLDCQWIDVTDVPPGRYTLELEVNPDLVLTESNYTNNVASVEVDITGPPPTATPLPMVGLDPIPAPIVLGQTKMLTGSGFSAGSVVVLFVAMPNGAPAFGPFVPQVWSPTSLTWLAPATVPLGNGFGTAVVVNTDQGFIGSNPQSQLLYGSAAANIPTILSIDGQGLQPAHPGVPLAYAQVVVVPGATVTLGGTGFNAPLVNLFSSLGNHGPLVPLPGGTATSIQVVVPGNAPTGPGAFQVVNNPYGTVVSNAVAVAIGATVSLGAVSQTGSEITVTGTGFSTLTVINLFNLQGSGVVNLGAFNAQGQPRIPLILDSPMQFRFTVPAGAVTGPAYVQAINPPYIGWSSSGADPDGAFMLTVPPAP